MPVVGGFKHALVSDGTGLNVDNSIPADVRYGSKADIERLSEMSVSAKDFGQVYSITSPAREHSGRHGEAEAFAVLRLIASSYLVAACTGSSAGFSPLRMRST